MKPEEQINKEFEEWFNDFYGLFSFRAEYFYEDVEVENVETRRDLMYKWVHSAFSYAYQKGFEVEKNSNK